MASAESETAGIGKSPEDVDAAQPDNQQFEQFLEEQTEPTSGSDTSEEPDGLPSREELWQVVQEQRDQMEAMQERIERLESKVEEAEFQADTVEDVVEQLNSGQIGGESGAAFIREFCSLPQHDSRLDARATKLFFTIIEEYRVDTPVTSSEVVKWFELGDSANPSVQAKRIMERLVEHREAGFYLGEIELKKHRGKNCIWLGN